MCAEHLYKRGLHTPSKEPIYIQKRPTYSTKRPMKKTSSLISGAVIDWGMWCVAVFDSVLQRDVCGTNPQERGLHTLQKEPKYIQKRPTNTTKRPMKETSSCVSAKSGAVVDWGMWCVAVLCIVLQRDVCGTYPHERFTYTQKETYTHPQEIYKHHTKTNRSDFRVSFKFIPKRPIYIQKRPRDLQTPQKDNWKRLQGLFYIHPKETYLHPKET